MKNNYRIAIFYFTLFSFLLIGSGFLLFMIKSGLSLEEVLVYYAPKSYEGVLKISQPHLLSIGLFIMVLSHFFLFSSSKKGIVPIVKILYITAGISILTPFFIYSDTLFMPYLKLIATLLFLLLSSYITARVLLLSLKKT